MIDSYPFNLHSWDRLWFHHPSFNLSEVYSLSSQKYQNVLRYIRYPRCNIPTSFTRLSNASQQGAGARAVAPVFFYQLDSGRPKIYRFRESFMEFHSISMSHIYPVVSEVETAPIDSTGLIQLDGQHKELGDNSMAFYCVLPSSVELLLDLVECGGT